MSDDKKVFRFEGRKIDTTWDGRLCIHVQECTRAKGELFESGREPWCQPDLGEADYVAEVVRRCPTGALTYDRKDGAAEEKAPEANTILLANNGPLYLSGELKIDGAKDDMPGVRFRAALCRCGDSQNKPFCDNTPAPPWARPATASTSPAGRWRSNGLRTGRCCCQETSRSSPGPDDRPGAAPRPHSVAVALRRTSRSATAATNRQASRPTDNVSLQRTFLETENRRLVLDRMILFGKRSVVRQPNRFSSRPGGPDASSVRMT
jgi:uncharacterized Fe-S cluster protein YjdI